MLLIAPLVPFGIVLHRSSSLLSPIINLALSVARSELV